MKIRQSISVALTIVSFCICESQATLSNVSHDPNDVHFYLYSDPANYVLEAGQLLDVNDLSTIQNADFLPNAPVKFIAHGFLLNYTCWQSQELKDRYFENNVEANVILVDWGPLAGPINNPSNYPIYPLVIPNTEIVGERVADLIQLLVQQRNISTSQIHLIGFSLGAHIFGFTGEEIQTRLNQSIARITGLDPAGPLFYADVPVGVVGRQLKKEDAIFVDAIHTSRGTAGTLAAVGDVDFYLNNDGFPPQPGCVGNPICSHNFAPNVFMQSIGVTDLCACPRTVVKTLAKSLLKPAAACTCGGDSVLFGDNATPSSGSSYTIKMTSAPLSGKYS